MNAGDACFYTGVNLHSKIFCVTADEESELWIGSANCTVNGLNHNYECMVGLKFKRDIQDEFKSWLEGNGFQCKKEPDEVESGEEKLIDKVVKNGAFKCDAKYQDGRYLVNIIVKYEGEETRKRHFDYRLKMGDNVYQPAKAQIKWYNYRSTLRDPDFAAGIQEIENDRDNMPTRFSIRPENTIVTRGSQVALHITAATQLMVPVRLINTSGKVVYQQSLLHDGDYQIPSDIPPGLYILQALNGKLSASAKIIIK